MQNGELLAWLSVWSEAQMICIAYGTADATATPSSLAPVNPDWFNLSGANTQVVLD